MYAIGNLYANGFGVGKDLAEAKRWYCRAAMLGHKQATEMLGIAEGIDLNVECPDAVKPSP